MKKIRYPIHSFKLDSTKLLKELRTTITIVNPKDNSKKLSGDFIWDTGATCSAINSSCVQKLGLDTIGLTKTYTANGVVDNVEIKQADLILPNKVTIKNAFVPQLNLQEGLLGLIGMDIINQGSFLIQNKNGKTSFQFSFPSLDDLNYIDFLNLAYNENTKNKKKLKKSDPTHPLLKFYLEKPKIKT